MFLTSIAALVLAAGAAAGDDTDAGESPKLPKGPQPKQVLARLDGDGNLVVREQVTEYRTETRVVEQVVCGVKVNRAVTVTVPVTTAVQRKYSAKAFEVYDASGKKVAGKKLSEALKKEKAVLVSVDGQKVDPFYLQLVKKDTLVVVPRMDRPK
jgi:hypothetical protein